MTSHHPRAIDHPPTLAAGPPRSGDWYTCAEHVFALVGVSDPQALARMLSALPVPGTAAWAALPADVKTWTLAWAGCMWVLHVDQDLQARVDASHEISDALDWSRVGARAAARAGSSYIPRSGAA